MYSSSPPLSQLKKTQRKREKRTPTATPPKTLENPTKPKPLYEEKDKMSPLEGNSRFDIPLVTYFDIKKFYQIQIILHFFGFPLLDAPKSLDNAVFVGIDAEWFESGNGDITELGIVILDAHDIRLGMDVFETLEAGLKAFHIRIKHNAHKVNTKKCPGHPDMFHFGTTKFVDMQEARDLLLEVFSHPSATGGLRDIIFVGHAVDNDLACMKKHFNVDLEQLGVIATTLDAQILAMEVGLEEQDVKISLKNLLWKFGIKEEFLHTAGNDIVYTMIACLLSATLFSAPYRSRSNQDAVNHLKKMLPLNSQPAWGIPVFCTRCDATTHCVDDCTVPMQCTICAASPTNSHQYHTHKTEKCVTEAKAANDNRKVPIRGVVIPCQTCVVSTNQKRWTKAHTHITENCTWKK